MRWLAEALIFAAIISLGAVNTAIYGEFVVGEHAGAQSRDSASNGTPAWQLAEQDASEDLPGTYVPTQGRRHLQDWSPDVHVPFCSDGNISEDCYASNPPTSGMHIQVTRGARLADGRTANLPPDPGVYDFEFPRESIPHIEEHAGVFIGYNCVTDACREAVNDVQAIVQRELRQKERVVMAPDSDLGADTIGMAAWTRYDVFATTEYEGERVRRFIEAHSCRVDDEHVCRGQQS